MATILEHINAEAQKQINLAYNPVVAMDCIAADTRAQLCRQIAGSLAGLEDDAALALIKQLRDQFNGRIKGDISSTITFVFDLSDAKWFDGIVDTVSVENRGWIEVGNHGFDGRLNKNLYLPRYRRMLDINHCVSSIGRLREETDSDWLNRRKTWLERYHPDVRVVHAEERWTRQGLIKVDLGNIQTFIEKEHLVESGLFAGSHRLCDMDCVFDVVELYDGYQKGALGKVRHVAGQPLEPGVHTICGYPFELVA
jgi:hypothetical protein